MTLKAATRYGRTFEFAGDTLSLWCYAEAGLAAEAAPRIGVRDSRGVGLPDVSLLSSGSSMPAQTWVELRFPSSAFQPLYKETRESQFQWSKLASIAIFQGLDDGQPHTLLIDDVRIVAGGEEDRAAPSAPFGLEVTGYDRHLDLAWQADPTAPVCSYRVYRSAEGQHYRQLATRPGNCRRYCDFVARPGGGYHYQVSAIDTHGNESARSQPAAGVTRRAG